MTLSIQRYRLTLDKRSTPRYNQRMDWEHCPDTFGYVRFERCALQDNANRYYILAWQPTLFGTGAVVRQFGRKGQSQRMLFNEFSSLDTAWPFIRAVIRARLRHHYQLTSSVNPD